MLLFNEINSNSSVEQIKLEKNIKAFKEVLFFVLIHCTLIFIYQHILGAMTFCENDQMLALKVPVETLCLESEGTEQCPLGEKGPALQGPPAHQAPKTTIINEIMHLL